MNKYKEMSKDKMSSNYEKVLEFNKAFGVKTNTTPQFDIFKNNDKLVQYRLSLIEEEFNELKEAVKTHDFTECLDGLGDSLYVIYGFFSALGVNGDDIFDIIHKSNMSKICDTENDAIETIKRYKEEIPQRYDSPAYRKSDCGKYFVVYNESTMKILKSYKYQKVNFTSLLEKK